ncbi:MAG TPA: heptaprenyl diphosphate synthase component 1 [Candidatus Bathyarchaeia archaeon]|nr:heptaprenyl diphosphate synthase component 1 [Candidatus Bathyarchaeia archaeon]
MTKEKTRGIDDVKEIFARMEKMASVPFVQKYVDSPPFAENRLALLFFFLCEEGLDRERAKTLCVTTGLVQLGLDTHESVRIRYEDTLVEERNRQLSVLAGDYYSAHYYHLLAEAGEVEAIRVLAEAIQSINEAKMKLYLSEKEDRLSSEGYIDLQKHIDTALYTAMVAHFAGSSESRRFWTSLFHETAAVECMIGAWEQLQWEDNAPFGFTRLLLQIPGTTISHVLSIVETKAMELMAVCEQLVRGFHSTEKQKLLEWIALFYGHRWNRLKRVIEEM